MSSIAELEGELRKNHARVLELRSLIERLEHEIVAEAGDLSAMPARIRRELESHFDQRLSANSERMEKLMDRFPPFLRSGWDRERWRDYDFQTQALTPFMTVGEAEEAPLEVVRPLRIPVFAPFIGEGRTLLIESGDENAADALRVMHGLIDRVATMLPYAAIFCLLDPETLGHAFPMTRVLPYRRDPEFDVSRTLLQILEDIAQINRDYLDSKSDSFEKLPDQVRATQRFEFIFVANFPKGWDRRSIEYLQKISRIGPEAGKYVFIHHNSEHELPPGLDLAGFRRVFHIPEDCLLSAGAETYEATWIDAPDESTERMIFEALASAKPVEHHLKFTDLTSSNPEEWWSESSAQEVRVPIGGTGAAGRLDLWLGRANDDRACAHGMLVGMTGSGKSVLYHTFICGLASRYSPEEVQLYLVDGKQGVEFQIYKNLPHARVVSLNTTPHLARSVLAELESEMRRRNEFFQENGFNDLPQHREAGSPGGKLPRIILLVDEYQTLFEDDKEGVGSQNMASLARQGRSAGIHMFVGSHEFHPSNMLHQGAIFGNMHLRLAMKMTEGDAGGLTEFGRSGRRLIKSCDVVGKVVLNDAAGDDGANKLGKVAWISPDERVRWVAYLERKAREVGFRHGSGVGPVLLNGSAQPEFGENPQWAFLRERHPARPDAKQWQEFAQRAQHFWGLGESQWYSGEHPTSFWMGQELNIHGHARVILRRRNDENILVVGESEEGRLGLVSHLLAQIPLHHSPTGLTVQVIDRSLAGSPWHGVLQSVVGRVLSPLKVQTDFRTKAEDAMELLIRAYDELQQRLSLGEDSAMEMPAYYFVVYDAQRLKALQKTVSRHGIKTMSEAGERLQALFTHGPEVGMHVVLAFSTVRSLQQVFETTEIERFRHRVAFQMSDSESYAFLRSYGGTRLKGEQSTPIHALYSDHGQNVERVFKPYCYNESLAESFNRHLQQIVELVSRWSEASIPLGN